MIWLWKLVLKLLNLIKGLLTNLSNYPGLGFLRSPANRLTELLSSYYTLQEKREHIERNLAITKQKAAELEHTVAPAHKKAVPADFSQPPEKAVRIQVGKVVCRPRQPFRAGRRPSGGRLPPLPIRRVR